MTTPLDLATIRPQSIASFEDHRGVLLKVLTAADHSPERARFGELYLCSTRQGETRGKHVHHRTTEWFCVVQGLMRIRLAIPGTAQRSEFLLEGDHPQVIRIPPGVAHSLTALSEEPCLLAAYADQPYDEADPDQTAYDL